MARRSVALALVIALAAMPRCASTQEPAPDEICKLLFEAYLNGPRKINNSTITAASHIVTERGRTSGFWKDVLVELKSGDEHSEVNCVRNLGNMLAIDAAARDAIRRQKETGEFSASIPSVQLGPEVLTELLRRSSRADRFRVDHYTIALARARAPEAGEIFRSILSAKQSAPEEIAAGKTVPPAIQHLDSTRFHAAVGLAQLGDSVGVEWLIANCEDIHGHVSSARPYGASLGGNLGSCCVAALQQLSEKRDLTSKAEWEAWRKTVDVKHLVGRAVVFADP